MFSDGIALLLLYLCQALALPLATQLSEEDEKVTKCITEILADTLSKPSPIPATSECMKILREDERVLAMLHHQHLLTELEELAHQENAKHRLGHEGSHAAWEEGEDEEQEEVKKRDDMPTQQKEAASEEMWEQTGERKGEEQKLREYEKTEKTEEKVKEEKVSREEDDHEALEKQAKEVMEEKDEDEEEVRKKKRSSSETWSSKEYFGHIKKRGSRQPKIREVMLHGDQDRRKRNGLVKRHFRPEEEEEDDHSAEHHHRGDNEGRRHHEDWEEEEEEEENKKKRSDLSKRVAEKASDEETAQFEEEEKGIKIANSQGHLHGGWKPWQEEEAEEKEGEMRHGHRHKPSGLDLRKGHQKDAVYLKGRHHGHEEDEDEREASQNEEELEKLEEIERELKKAAEKLEELKRG